MEQPRLWRLRRQLYQLEGTRCRRCGVSHFPPRDICGDCGSWETEPRLFSGRGKLYSVSEQRTCSGSHGTVKLFGLIELDEGGLVFAQLTDVLPKQVAIGMPLQMVIRRLRSGERSGNGPIVYAYKFRAIWTGNGLTEASEKEIEVQYEC